MSKRLAHGALPTIWDDLVARGYVVHWEEEPTRPRGRRSRGRPPRDSFLEVAAPVALCVAGVFLLAIALGRFTRP